MRVEGHHVFDVSREELWKALLDPNIISKTLPGCDQLTQVGENEYGATFNIQIGPVQGEFKGEFALSDLNPPETYNLRVSGKGTTGFLEGEGNIRLEEHNRSTRLHYQFDVQVGGRVASVGQRLLDSSARVISRQGLEQLAQQIEARRNEDEATKALSQKQFAANVAKGVLADLLARNPTVVVLSVGGLLLLLLIFFWAYRG